LDGSPDLRLVASLRLPIWDVNRESISLNVRISSCV
jgi:hypothetical protein